MDITNEIYGNKSKPSPCPTPLADLYSKAGPTTSSSNYPIDSFSLSVQSQSDSFFSRAADYTADRFASLGDWYDRFRGTTEASTGVGLTVTTTAASGLEELDSTGSRNISAGPVGKTIGAIGKVVDAATGTLEAASEFSKERKAGSVLYPRTFRSTVKSSSQILAAGLAGTAAIGAVAVGGVVAPIAVFTAAAVGTGYAVGKAWNWLCP